MGGKLADPGPRSSQLLGGGWPLGVGLSPSCPDLTAAAHPGCPSPHTHTCSPPHSHILSYHLKTHTHTHRLHIILTFSVTISRPLTWTSLTSYLVTPFCSTAHRERSVCNGSFPSLKTFADFCPLPLTPAPWFGSASGTIPLTFPQLSLPFPPLGSPF